MKTQPNTSPTAFSEVHRNEDAPSSTVEEIFEQISEAKRDAKELIEKAAKQLREAEKAELEAKQAQLAKLRQEREKLLTNARRLREAVRGESDPAAKVNLIALAEADEAQARAIHIEGEELPDSAAMPEPPKFFGISTNQGIFGVVVLAIISALLFYTVGTSLIQDEANDSAARMMNSVGLRVVTNFFIFSLAMLVPVGFMWLLFPPVFRYWHNRIETQLSLSIDLENSPSWLRIAFFSFSYALPVWAFVQLMQVIFG